VSDRISWDRYDGDAIEAVVAIFLLRVHRHGERRKPSRGDKGIDVLIRHDDGTWTVYQVKRFTKPLTSKQKDSIVESWERLHTYVLSRGITVREWIVARPRDATTEETEWLAELTAPAGIPSQWLGEANLDALATEFPEVVDYYLLGGEQRAFDMAMQLFKAAHLERDVLSSVSLSVDDARDGLTSLFKAVNAADPHYVYEFSVGLHRSSMLDNIPDDPNLVWTSEVVRDGVQVRTSVFRRYDLADEDSPLDFELNVAFRPQDDTQRKELQAFTEFGAPLESMPADISGTLPGADIERELASEVTVIPAAGGRRSGDYTMVVTASGVDSVSGTVHMDGHVKAERGWSWTGNVGGRIGFTIFGSYDRSHHGIRISPFTVETLTPNDALLILRLQQTLSIGGELRLEVPHGPLVLSMSATADDADADNLRSLNAAIKAMLALTTIQRATTEPIRVPTLATSLGDSLRDWHRAADLLTSGERTAAWDHFILHSDSKQTALPDLPAELLAVIELRVRIGDQQLRLGHVVQRCLATTASRLDDGRLRFEPGKDRRVLERLTTDVAEIALAGRVLIRPVTPLPPAPSTT
jgi:hypothetical protein